MRVKWKTMDNFKQTAEKWAEEILAKQSKIDFEFREEFLEFAILGSLLYDKDGKRIPRLKSDDNFEFSPVELKNGKI